MSNRPVAGLLYIMIGDIHLLAKASIIILICWNIQTTFIRAFVIIPSSRHRIQQGETSNKRKGLSSGRIVSLLSSTTDVPHKLHPTSSDQLLKIPSRLVNTLDLSPLINHVASYACTKRGKEALIDLVYTPPSNTYLFDMNNRRDGLRKPSLLGNNVKSRRDWYRGMKQDISHQYTPPISIAQSAEEAILEYKLVSEAMEILQSQQSSSRIPLPPMFALYDGVSSSSSSPTAADSDDDEWIDLCLDSLPPGVDIYQEIDLENILQAEQVVKLLIETYDWAMSDTIKWRSTGLVDVVKQMEYHSQEDEETERQDGNIDALLDLYQELNGAVEVVRAGPSISDPNNKFSYQFQLSAGTGRWPELDTLKAKEEQTLKQKGDISQKLAIIKNEIIILEDQITRQLIAGMIRGAQEVQRGMTSLARLDIIFAKASFGCEWNGVVPEIDKKGRLNVEQFIHPVLALEGNERITPVDLIMPANDEGYQTLMISGPNGGGKTLALKSFGLVSMMVKLSLPITISQSQSSAGIIPPPIVDYFEDILVEVGDSQSISKHESTLMARLNALSSLIQTLSSSDSREGEKLVLLDELGGGTDPNAGAAIAQSILEELISSDSSCKIVATTHSPQLKVLSVNDSRFHCASVLMNSDKTNPTFQLSYGTTGESYTLEAGRRAKPSLPEHVLDRAAQLMNGGEADAVESLNHYLSALENEQQAAKQLVQQTEETLNEVSEHKQNMISKFKVSTMQLSRLESRLESIYEQLSNEDTRSTYELVGDSLDELRLLKIVVQSEEEILSDKGLRRVSDSYTFYDGESVVIIADGEWQGYDAIVKEVDTDDSSVVTVVPVLDLFSPIGEDTEPLTLSRRDVAVFDYPDPYDDIDYSSPKQKKSSGSDVLSVLSTLDTGTSKPTPQKASNKEKAYTSSRQRKAAGKNKSKKGNKKKR